MQRWRSAGAVLLGVSGFLVPWLEPRRAGPPAALPLEIAVAPGVLKADGHSNATAILRGPAPDMMPRLDIAGPRRGIALAPPVRSPGGWMVTIRSGVMAGEVRLVARLPGASAASAVLTLTLDTADSAGDGTPDFIRLDTAADRAAFRRWFTFLAEAQYFQAPSSRPREITDCAALIRYAYREAIREHGSDWAETARLPLLPPYAPVSKYAYPHTPLGASLFRVRSGPFDPADLQSGTFLQFADANTLRRWNTFPVGRQLAEALPGDLLFFRGSGDSWHSMIFVGRSHVRDDGRDYVVYHTGPRGREPGEIRRLSVSELLAFPQAEWRPLAANPSFAGISRWNLFAKESDAPVH